MVDDLDSFDGVLRIHWISYIYIIFIGSVVLYKCGMYYQNFIFPNPLIGINLIIFQLFPWTPKFPNYKGFLK